jgi:hypothetical protein
MLTLKVALKVAVEHLYSMAAPLSNQTRWGTYQEKQSGWSRQMVAHSSTVVTHSG